MGGLFSHESKKGGGSHAFAPPASSTGASNTAAVGASVTSKDRAVLELKVARDKLKKYQKKLEKESVKLTEQAKALIRQDKKDRALLVIKLKKHKEKEYSNVDGQLLNVMQMLNDIEWESHNLEILKALKTGNDALNSIHQEMGVDEVEKLLADTNEAIEMQNEIDKMIASQFGAVLDDDELNAEFESLMVELHGTSTPAAAAEAAVPAAEPIVTEAAIPSLPEVPSHEIRLPEQPEAAEEQQEEVVQSTGRVAVAA